MFSLLAFIGFYFRFIVIKEFIVDDTSKYNTVHVTCFTAFL